MKAIYNIPKEGIKAIFKVDKYIKVEDLEGFATSENLTDEILRATARENEIDGKVVTLDEKLDGININLTKQIDDLEKDANDKYNELTRDIDDLTDVVEEDFSNLDNKITTTSQTINTRITDVADEINQSIEENVVALQGEDNALQSQINSQNQTLTAYDTRITSNANAISQEVIDRQNGDDILTGEIENIAGELDSKADKSEIPTNVSELENDSKYTTEQQVAQMIASIPQFEVKIIQELPTTGEPMVLYLVPKEGEAPDVYLEYIWLATTQTFELIGSTTVDLTDYVKNTDYATTIKSGVIRIDSNLGTDIGSEGNIRGTIRTKEQYNNDSILSILSKGTLENIKENLVTSIGDSKYQPILTAGNGIDITDNKISNNIQFVITEDMFDLEYDDTKGVAPYSTSYGYTNVTIHDDAGVEWVEGASYSFVLDTKISDSTYRNVRVRIGESGDWKPLMSRGGVITVGSTYFTKVVNVPYRYQTNYQQNGALHVVEYNTTYTINYSLDNGQHTGGVGAYAITRYSLCMQKPDMTWEKITNTSKNYTTYVNKKVNKNGFLLNHIRYYGTTMNIANGALIANNVMYTKSASVDASYSFNCSTTPNWGVGKQVYLVGTIGDDGLFYLDENQWWSVELPTSNDGKLYIRIGLTYNATNSTITFLDDRPIVYHDGTGIREYVPTGAVITKTSNNQSGTITQPDGRMEQWGLATSSNTGETEFIMNNSFVDTNFQVFVEPRQAGDLVHYAIPSATNKFKARIQNTSGAYMTCQFQWRAYGFWK